MSTEQFSLCWDNFHKNMSSGMHSLLESGDLVDVTLAVEGKCLRAHKMVLSVCSPYFRNLFKTNPCKHPIVFMKDVTYSALSDLLQFMYQGEVQVSQEHLSAFIKTAEALQIKGLTGGISEPNDVDVSDFTIDEVKQTLTTPTPEKQEQDSSETVKTSTRVKRQLSGRPAKRPKTTNASPATPTTTATIKATVDTPKVLEKGETSATARDLVQFKMEPYEISDATVAEQETSADETFGNESLDMEGGQQEETEDYSLMSGMEDEPQAGTSGEGAEGAEEGQVKYTAPSTLVKTASQAILHGGFVYHTSVIKRNPPRRYLICAKYAKSGCRARAVLPTDKPMNCLRITQPHNHPPDLLAQERNCFLNDLRATVQSSSSPIKECFESVIELYLRCLEYKRLGCHARAVIPSDGTIQDIKVNKPHNHPPDYAAEQKIVFLRELKEVMLQNPNIPPRDAYATLSEMYPIAARETPYELIRHKMNRWRRTVLGGNGGGGGGGSSPSSASVKCEF